MVGAAPAHGYLGALSLPASGPRPMPCTATPQLCLPQTTYKQAPVSRVLRGSRAFLVLLHPPLKQLVPCAIHRALAVALPFVAS